MQEYKNFASIYQKLNSDQRVAVDSIEGPVMVIAGPGTGKTQVLASRIANILKIQDVDPSNILALTFTEAAAKNMRERIVEMIGNEGYYVAISTFHSFASEVIAQYPDKFPIDRGSKPLSDIERFEIFEKIIFETNLQILKPLNNPLCYLKDIISQISNLKRENISLEKFESILNAEEEILENEIDDLKKVQKIKRTKDLNKQKELYLLYVKYEAELRANLRFDFDDMISLIVEIFEKDEEILLDYKEKFQYVLVDEYQDTNSAQNKIVDLLCTDQDNQPNIFVVGDPHQSIYRFQGASVENMLGFVNKYPNAKVITLQTGYRCSQIIYDAAHNLIENNELGINFSNNSVNQFTDKTIKTSLLTRLKSVNNQNDPIRLFEANSSFTEKLFVVEEIKKLIKLGVNPEEIAVLYKDNSDSLEISEILEKENVVHDSNSADNALKDKLIIQLLKLFKVINGISNGSETDLIFEVMMFDWINLDSLTVMKVARIAAKEKEEIFTIISTKYENLDKKYDLNQHEFEKIVEFRDKLIYWQKNSHNLLFNKWFSLVINSNFISKDWDDQKPDVQENDKSGFGFLDNILSKPTKVNHLIALNTLFSHIKQTLSQDVELNLSKFLLNIQIMREHNIVLKTEMLNIARGRIKLSTVHKAKGQEWQYVFILNCVDKKWGNKQKRDMIPLPTHILTNTDISKKEKNEDDRRLFYVAITRAKKQVFISYPQTKISGGKNRELIMSMFIKEIADFITVVDSNYKDKLNVKAEKLIEEMLQVTADGTSSTDLEIEFFRQLVSEFKMSVTALNNYLKDKNEFILNTLLRVPREKNPVMSFGTSVHYALEQFYKKFTINNQVISLTEFQNDFMRSLKNENLSSLDFEERKERGIKVLSFYYEEIKNNVSKPLFIERYFGGNFCKAVLMDAENEIKLSGRIDRVDLIDADNKLVRIIHYKTGKSKTDAQIEGKTYIDDYSDRELKLPETIRGRYKRQLVFYKLLTMLDKTFKYNVAQAVFDFVEPSISSNGDEKHIQRQFTISTQAVEDLKVVIIEVMREIRELGFLNQK
ncbi:MAG: ATP-dependent helicase [Pseudomonadales bacterium]|nr:ATP-dependent helicase [Pseudomonadales bacterium]